MRFGVEDGQTSVVAIINETAGPWPNHLRFSWTGPQRNAAEGN